jgi:2-polyprenyl-6-methoxyphenol hydroxylase-like FAD-dependent oxidoreductase
MTDTEVLIAGAGPVGLVLAIDLAQRGISVELIERNDSPRQLPKMERCNARTMEIYRRLGLAEQVRAASKFRDVPMDVFVITSMADPALVHLEYPSVTEWQQTIREKDDCSLPAEPYQLISQYTLEPLLKSVVEAMPNVNVRFSTEFVSFTQDSEAVESEIVGPSGTETVRSQYLVGCDGGASSIRKQLGIKLEGDGHIKHVYQIFFRSEELFDKIEMGQGRHYYSPNGAMVVQDDLRHFMLNCYEIPLDTDPIEIVRDFLRIPVDVEVLHVSDWYFNLLVAERYGQRRVLIAGDAAHLVIPIGGLGMNTGVGDAIDLSWKIAGTLAGWGGPNLVASYEAERRPIGIRNNKAAREAARGVLAWQMLCTVDLREDNPEAASQREKVASVASKSHATGYSMTGIELGYRYVDSPLITGGDEGGPDPNAMVYTPTSVPGARIPHAWLDDGRAMQDVLGRNFTLLQLGHSEVDTGPLQKAFQEFGAPFDVVEISDERLAELYGPRLYLIRPDLHIAWHGDEVPDHPEQIVRKALGYSAR